MVAEIVHIPVQPETPAPVFSPARRGYDCAEVDDYVARTEQELAELRWWHESLDAERAALTEERRRFEAERDAWKPSFAALGGRVERMVVELRAEIETQRTRLEKKAAVEQERAEARRAQLERELRARRRDAELEATGLLARARAQAEDVRAAADRAADQLLTDARRQVEDLGRVRRSLIEELEQLRERVVQATNGLDPEAPVVEIPTGQVIGEVRPPG